MVTSTRVPVFTVTALDLSCMVTVSNSVRSSLCATSSLRNLTKAVRSGVASFAENPQKRRKEDRSPRDRVALDLGIGKSTLGKWVLQYRPSDLVAAPQADLARENERLRLENRVLRGRGKS